jgi:sec-independent protein translocase protein TatB
MANISMADTIILMVLALVVFGPRRLPQIGKQIGKLMYEFRKASNDFKFQMEEELRQSEEADRRQKEEAERQRALAAAPPAPQLDVPAPQTDQSAESVAESAAAATPETPTESPYPGETTYPDPAAESARPEEAAAVAVESTSPVDEAAPAEDLMASAVEAARLRIQPPSTGEVVAANPPGQAPQQAELFEPLAEPPGQAPQPSEPAAGVAVNDDTSGANEAEPSEPAAHHG